MSTAATQRRPLAINLAGAASLARRPALWLAPLTFALYLPPAVSVLQLNPDAVEYIDVARRLAAGEGYVLGIKGYFIGGTQVLHNGLDERPPLYPLLAAGLLRLGFGLTALQVVNAMLAGVCAALVYAIGSCLFDRRTGILAGLLAAASPPMLIFMVPPMTEALATCLTLLATWLIVRDLAAPRPGSFIAAGAALGLGYLTHPTRALLAAALLLGLILAARGKRDQLRRMSPVLVGMAIFLLPVALYSLSTRGSISYSGQTYMYSVFDDNDIGVYAPRSLPSPTEFILAHPGFVAGAILRSARDYARDLFLGRDWLLILLPAWPLAFIALVRGRYRRAVWPVLLVAVANFVISALTWATYQERYLLATLLLLLPFAVDGLSRLGLARFSLPGAPGITGLHLAIGAIVLIWSPVFVEEYRGQFRQGDDLVESRSDYGLRWTGPANWVRPRDLRPTMDWIKAETRREDVLAHHSPWLSTFFTERPSTRLPRGLNTEGLRTFLVDYQVAYVLLNTEDYRRRYQDNLQALGSDGVRASTIGSQPVFDTRALWQ